MVGVKAKKGRFAPRAAEEQRLYSSTYKYPTFKLEQFWGSRASGFRDGGASCGCWRGFWGWVAFCGAYPWLARSFRTLPSRNAKLSRAAEHLNMDLAQWMALADGPSDPDLPAKLGGVHSWREDQDRHEEDESRCLSCSSGPRRPKPWGPMP